MRIKHLIIVLYLIVFIVSIIRTIYFSKNTSKCKEVNTSCIVLMICTIVMGVALVVVNNFTNIGDELIFKPSEKKVEVELDEVAEVYDISNIYYLTDTKKYIVTINLPDGGKKVITLGNDLIIYNTVKDGESEYIEIYDEKSNKQGKSNKVYLRELQDEEEDDPVPIVSEDEEIEEVTGEEDDDNETLVMIITIIIVVIIVVAMGLYAIL